MKKTVRWRTPKFLKGIPRDNRYMLNFLQNGLLGTVQTPHIQVLFYISIFLCIAVPYLLGSFNTAVFVYTHILGEDVREKGSGNAGLTNTNRVYGGKVALLVLLGDALKTALSILFAGVLFGFYYVNGFSGNSFAYIAALFCMLGHVFPVFYRFKGGKGVLCTFISALILCPIVAGILICIFALILGVTKYVSLSSIIAGVMFPFVLDRTLSLFGMVPDGLIVLSTIIIALLVVWCHRENIKRIMNKTESKFSFKKNKKQ